MAGRGQRILSAQKKLAEISDRILAAVMKSGDPALLARLNKEKDFYEYALSEAKKEKRLHRSQKPQRQAIKQQAVIAHRLGVEPHPDVDLEEKTVQDNPFKPYEIKVKKKLPSMLFSRFTDGGWGISNDLWNWTKLLSGKKDMPRLEVWAYLRTNLSKEAFGSIKNQLGELRKLDEMETELDPHYMERFIPKRTDIRKQKFLDIFAENTKNIETKSVKELQAMRDNILELQAEANDAFPRIDIKKEVADYAEKVQRNLVLALQGQERDLIKPMPGEPFEQAVARLREQEKLAKNSPNAPQAISFIEDWQKKVNIWANEYAFKIRTTKKSKEAESFIERGRVLLNEGQIMSRAFPEKFQQSRSDELLDVMPNYISKAARMTDIGKAEGLSKSQLQEQFKLYQNMDVSEFPAMKDKDLYKLARRFIIDMGDAEYMRVRIPDEVTALYSALSRIARMRNLPLTTPDENPLPDNDARIKYFDEYFEKEAMWEKIRHDIAHDEDALRIMEAKIRKDFALQKGKVKTSNPENLAKVEELKARIEDGNAKEKELRTNLDFMQQTIKQSDNWHFEQNRNFYQTSSENPFGAVNEFEEKVIKMPQKYLDDLESTGQPSRKGWFEQKAKKLAQDKNRALGVTLADVMSRWDKLINQKVAENEKLPPSQRDPELTPDKVEKLRNDLVEMTVDEHARGLKHVRLRDTDLEKLSQGNPLIKRSLATVLFHQRYDDLMRPGVKSGTPSTSEQYARESEKLAASVEMASEYRGKIQALQEQKKTLPEGSDVGYIDAKIKTLQDLAEREEEYVSTYTPIKAVMDLAKKSVVSRAVDKYMTGDAFLAMGPKEHDMIRDYLNSEEFKRLGWEGVLRVRDDLMGMIRNLAVADVVEPTLHQRGLALEASDDQVPEYIRQYMGKEEADAEQAELDSRRTQDVRPDIAPKPSYSYKNYSVWNPLRYAKQYLEDTFQIGPNNPVPELWKVKNLGDKDAPPKFIRDVSGEKQIYSSPRFRANDPMLEVVRNLRAKNPGAFTDQEQKKIAKRERLITDLNRPGGPGNNLDRLDFTPEWKVEGEGNLVPNISFTRTLSAPRRAAGKKADDLIKEVTDDAIAIQGLPLTQEPPRKIVSKNFKQDVVPAMGDPGEGLTPSFEQSSQEPFDLYQKALSYNPKKDNEYVEQLADELNATQATGEQETIDARLSDIAKANEESLAKAKRDEVERYEQEQEVIRLSLLAQENGGQLPMPSSWKGRGNEFYRSAPGQLKRVKRQHTNPEEGEYDDQFEEKWEPSIFQKRYLAGIPEKAEERRKRIQQSDFWQRYQDYLKNLPKRGEISPGIKWSEVKRAHEEKKITGRYPDGSTRIFEGIHMPNDYQQGLVVDVPDMEAMFDPTHKRKAPGKEEYRWRTPDQLRRNRAYRTQKHFAKEHRLPLIDKPDDLFTPVVEVEPYEAKKYHRFPDDNPLARMRAEEIDYLDKEFE